MINNEVEIIVKKSRFVSYYFEINNKNQVQEIINNLKQEHKKARHICYAFTTSNNGVLNAGMNNDGEPKGTAGKPILELINLKKVSNILVVVVRYFGGILLGAGGLIRAYRTSASEAINLYLLKRSEDEISKK
ncbi:YigZ family protein [Mycoplasma leonicaptivi]|uniref:YigZ family protein n=1 Tax=Mycoplasma leonicaptivi TaxID=36742 RepID=UPI000483589B|nr:YigZ family protein [Mycoplasma leonicaptivi]